MAGECVIARCWSHWAQPEICRGRVMSLVRSAVRCWYLVAQITKKKAADPRSTDYNNSRLKKI